MTAVTAPGGASTRRILMASMVGTAIEFYDFYIYATAAALVFGPLFFPAASPSTQLFASYATFGIAFVARPLGGIAFGHFGDRVGRKTTLVAALLLMGISTVSIGLLPTYAMVGWPATALLCLLRFGQGLGLGGEWGGATLLAVENAPPGYRARFGMFPPLGAPLGFIASNGFFLILGATLTSEQFVAWGWRLPFISSAVLVIIGLWVRLRLTETPAFKAALAAAEPPKVPLAEVVRDYPWQIIGGMFSVVACFSLYYLATVFVLGYGTMALGFTRNTFLALQLAAIPFMAIGTIWSGYWSDATTPRRVQLVGCAGVVGVGLLLAPMLGSGSTLVVWLLLALAMLVMGLVYGPMGCYLPGLFSARVRYTGVSLTFNIGGIIGGGASPMIAQALAERGGLGLVGMYLSGAAVLSIAALIPLGRARIAET